ncbi:hypothetical protein BDV18DRAFT_120753 [Aspergillus unguis]
MGGIPYTSGGCGTCRRRKVKCDETKPECLRCTKYGHQCTGYDKKRLSGQGRTATAAEKASKLAPAPNVALVKASMVSVPRPNVNPELRSQLLSTFIESYLPLRQNLHDSSGRSFLATLPELSQGSAILEKAGICLASVFLAKLNQDDRLLQYSSRLYGNTLRNVHGKITSGATFGQDILYTTVVLQLYELIHSSPPGFSAWIAHVQGGIAISMQTSAQGKRTIAEKLFQRQLKYVTLCDSIGKRKAPYLYNTQLWRHDPQSMGEIDPIDEFIHLLAKCCVIMEQVDHYALTLPDSTEERHQTGDQLLRTCLEFEEELHQACVSMQHKLGEPTVAAPGDVPRGDFRDTLDTDLFPSILNFASLACAESHLAYWTTLILLYPLIGELSSILDGPHRDVPVPIYYDCTNGGTAKRVTRKLTADTPSAYTALAEHYAGEICRSVFYFIQPEMKTLGAQNLLAPFSQCVQFFSVEGLTTKLRWCQSVLSVLPHLGLGLAPLLKEMVWPQYRSAQGRRRSAEQALNG